MPKKRWQDQFRGHPRGEGRLRAVGVETAGSRDVQEVVLAGLGDSQDLEVEGERDITAGASRVKVRLGRPELLRGLANPQPEGPRTRPPRSRPGEMKFCGPLSLHTLPPFLPSFIF